MSNTLVYLFGKVWVGGRKKGNFGKGKKISEIGGRRREEGIGVAIIGGGYWKSVEGKEIFFARG